MKGNNNINQGENVETTKSDTLTLETLTDQEMSFFEGAENFPDNTAPLFANIILTDITFEEKGILIVDKNMISLEVGKIKYVRKFTMGECPDQESARIYVDNILDSRKTISRSCLDSWDFKSL